MTDSEKLSFLVEAVTKQDKKMDALEKSLKEEIQKVQDDVASVKLIMENELRKNISIVAENHLDL